MSFKFRKYNTAFNSGLKIWLVSDFPAKNPLLNGMFCYICIGLVLNLCHIFKPQNVVGNIFSELTLKASLLLSLNKLLLKILRENWKPNRTLSINFVLKIRFRENPLWNENLKPNFAWKYTLYDNSNFAEKLCVEFFKFWKYYAAHNSGLKIWLVSGIFEMAQSLNLKFCVYLCWLGVAFSPHF